MIRIVAAVTLTLACTPRQQYPAPPALAPARYTDSIPGTLVTFEMVAVPAGTPFWIGRTEVTWDAYDAFALAPVDSTERRGEADAVARPTRPYGAPDYGWGHAGYPVMSVARPASEAFCVWLSAKTGKKYRLPTEAEWVLAARLAGRGLSAPLDSVAWHSGNAGGTTHRVGVKRADVLGLHDLFGNVAEWVMSESRRPVALGGSFRDAAEAVGPDARAEQVEAWNERDPQIPKSRWWLSDGPFVGFRIVREP